MRRLLNITVALFVLLASVTSLKANEPLTQCFALLHKADYTEAAKLLLEQAHHAKTVKELRSLHNAALQGARLSSRSSNIEAARQFVQIQLQLAAKTLEAKYPSSDYVTVYHYTSTQAIKSINASGQYVMKAVLPSQQANKKGKGNKKKAVYLSPWSPARVKNEFKKYLGITREKYEIVIVLRLPKAQVKDLKGGRGEQVKYHQGDLIVDRLDAFHMYNPYLQ